MWGQTTRAMIKAPQTLRQMKATQQTITYSASAQECGEVSADIRARQVFVRGGGIAVPLRHIGSTYLFGPFQEPYPERR